jgi:hypothetical protein
MTHEASIDLRQGHRPQVSDGVGSRLRPATCRLGNHCLAAPNGWLAVRRLREDSAPRAEKTTAPQRDGKWPQQIERTALRSRA